MAAVNGGQDQGVDARAAVPAHPLAHRSRGVAVAAVPCAVDQRHMAVGIRNQDRLSGTAGQIGDPIPLLMIEGAGGGDPDDQDAHSGQYETPFDMLPAQQPEQHRAEQHGDRRKAEGVAPVDQPERNIRHKIGDPQNVIEKRLEQAGGRRRCRGQHGGGHAQHDAADEADRSHADDQQIAHQREHGDRAERGQQNGRGENGRGHRTGDRAHHGRGQLFHRLGPVGKRAHHAVLHPAGEQDQAERRSKGQLQAQAGDRIGIEQEQQRQRSHQGIQAVGFAADDERACRNQVHDRSADDRRRRARDRHEKQDHRNGDPCADPPPEQQIAEGDEEGDVHTGHRDHMAQAGDLESQNIVLGQRGGVADEQAVLQSGLARRQRIQRRLLAEACNALRQPAQPITLPLDHGKGDRLVVFVLCARRGDVPAVGRLIGGAVKAFGRSRQIKPDIDLNPVAGEQWLLGQRQITQHAERTGQETALIHGKLRALAVLVDVRVLQHRRSDLSVAAGKLAHRLDADHAVGGKAGKGKGRCGEHAHHGEQPFPPDERARRREKDRKQEQGKVQAGRCLQTDRAVQRRGCRGHKIDQRPFQHGTPPPLSLLQVCGCEKKWRWCAFHTKNIPVSPQKSPD